MLFHTAFVFAFSNNLEIWKVLAVPNRTTVTKAFGDAAVTNLPEYQPGKPLQSNKEKSTQYY